MSFLLRIAARALGGEAAMLMPKGLSAFRSPAPQPDDDGAMEETGNAATASRAPAIRRSAEAVTDDAPDYRQGEQPPADADGNPVSPMRRAMVPTPEDESDGSPQADRAWRIEAEPNGREEEAAGSRPASRMMPAGETSTDEPEDYPDETRNARAPGGVMAKRVARSFAPAPMSSGNGAAGPGILVEGGGRSGETAFDAWRPVAADESESGLPPEGEGPQALESGGSAAEASPYPSHPTSSRPDSGPEPTVIEQIDVFVSEPAAATAQRPRLGDTAALLAARYMGTL